jgi:hypothetical protein
MTSVTDQKLEPISKKGEIDEFRAISREILRAFSRTLLPKEQA